MIEEMLSRFFKRSTSFHVLTLTDPSVMDEVDRLPAELRYVIAARSERTAQFKAVMERGYGLAIRRMTRTPERVLQAVERMARLSQEGTVISWLPALLSDGEMPIVTPQELERGAWEGVNLEEEARVLMAVRGEFRNIVLADLQNIGIGADEQAFICEVNEDLSSFAVRAALLSLLRDHAKPKPKPVAALLKVAAMLGPVAHVTEAWVSGLGKTIAAIGDDALSEATNAVALHGSGYTPRQLWHRLRPLIPVYALAAYGAFQAGSFIQSGHAWAGGLLFGVSAVFPPFIQSIRDVFTRRRAYARLIASRKRSLAAGQTLTSLAWREETTDPAHAARMIGIVATPIVAAAAFHLCPAWTDNGWFLALTGSVEIVVAAAVFRFNAFKS